VRRARIVGTQLAFWGIHVRTIRTNGSQSLRDAFTLVELMIVVVILAVLAGTAMLAYQRWVIRARTAEAAGLLANIKGSQESYRAEFGIYCNVGDGIVAPVGTLGREPITWDDATLAAGWKQLGFRPDSAALSFQVETVAGGPGVGIPGGWVADTEIALPTTAAEFTQDFWFLARARADQDEDGRTSLFWITNMTTGVGRKRSVE